MVRAGTLRGRCSHPRGWDLGFGFCCSSFLAACISVRSESLLVGILAASSRPFSPFLCLCCINFASCSFVCAMSISFLVCPLFARRRACSGGPDRVCSRFAASTGAGWPRSEPWTARAPSSCAAAAASAPESTGTEPSSSPSEEGPSSSSPESSSSSSSSAIASTPPVPLTPREAVLSYLRKVGWHRHYATPIAAAVAARAPRDALARVKAAVSWLASHGFSSSQAENMALVCRELLCADRATLQDAFDWLAERGVDAASRTKLLLAEPSLLTYAVSEDRKILERGKARALVVVEGSEEQAGGKAAAGTKADATANVDVNAPSPASSVSGAGQELRVFQWREGAMFGSTPVSSQAPPL